MAKDKDKATEAPQAEASTDQEPKAAAPKAEKPAGPSPEELLGNLRTAVTDALTQAAADGKLAEVTVEPLQQAYRKIPAARRGSVQAEILKEAMTTPGVNHQAVASVLEEMTKAPQRETGTRTPRPEIPAHVTLGHSLAALDVARQAILTGIDSDVASQATALASELFSNGIEDEAQRDSVLTAATKAVNAVKAKARKSGTGTGGPRIVKTEGLAQLIERGDLKAGDTLKAGDRTATITADGKIEVGGNSFDNPTAAAKGAGVTTSVNGWAFWTVERGGKNIPVGDLRKS